MPTYIRVKDLPNSASQLGSDDYLYLSGATFGARKIEKADFLSTVADSFNAAPSTYKLATLDAGNKVDASQWPASAFSYQGTWAASTNTPTLANGSGTAGYTYYASDAGSVNFGAGAISFTAGDAVVYNGSIWQKVPDVVNILDGKGTVDEGKTTLQIPNVGTAANEVSLNGMLGSMAYQDFDAFYQTGNWTPTLSFSGGSTGISYGANTFGYYTKIGNTVSYSGYLTLTSKGSDSGYVYLHVPFTTASATESHQSGITFGVTSGMASLTSAISGVYLQNDSKILLYDTGATGANALSEANLTGASELRFSGTYQTA